MNLKFIVGATGCGKTTLAQHISNTDVIISLDAFSKSIRYVFPDFKLYGKDISIKPTKNCDIFLDLVSKYIQCFISDYPDKDIIIEGCHFTPQEILIRFPNSKIIALGITDSSKALSQINKRDWMSGLDDSVKFEYVRQIVEYSLMLKCNADKYLYLEFDENRTDYAQCITYFA